MAFPYMPGAEGFMANPYMAAYGAPFAAAAALPYAAAYGGRTAGQPQGAASEDEQRTVFLSGFPEDIKERELNNLLRFLPGYEASQMHWKNGQAQGFALFNSNSAAVGACEAIAGLCFDDNVYLRAEMARKNMYIKDMMGGAALSQAPEPKRMRATGSFAGAGAVGGMGAGGAYNAPRPGGGAGGMKSDAAKDNPPCNTLFVGNLGDAADEGELRQLFGQQAGFVQLKLITGRAVSCFVEFDSVPNATAAHQALQGATLSTSTRGGIRIQFSKNSFGSRKRDAEGNIMNTGGNTGGYDASGAGIGGAGAGAGGGYKPNMGGMYDPAAAAAAAIAAATGIPQQ